MRFLTRSLVGLFLAALTLALLAIGAMELKTAIEISTAPAPPAKPAEERAFTARVMTLRPERIAPLMTAYGEVRASRRLELRSASAGEIVELVPEFADGTAVAAGQLLVRIDPADAQSARDIAETQLRQAEVEARDAARALVLARDDLAAAEDQRALRAQALNRQKELGTRGLGMAADMEAAELAMSGASQGVVSRRQALALAEARTDKAAAAIDAARLTLAEAERRLADTELRAGFAGVLSGVTAVAGGLVANGEKLGELIDPTALEVAVRLSTAQFARLIDEAGRLRPLPVTAALDVPGGRLEAAGRLARVDAAVGAGLSGRLVFATLDEAPGFRPGDFVTLEIAEPPIDGVALVPAQALGTDGTVLVLGEGDRLEAVPADILRRQGDAVILRVGALSGREIVLERTALLGAGILVRPVRDQDSGLSGADGEPVAFVELSPERRAALIAYVEDSAAMSDAAKAEVLARLREARVPSEVVDRLEARMGAEPMAARHDRLAAAGGILSYFTRHATAANLVLALFLAAGLAALPQMRAQYFPDVVVQQVNVAVTWDDAGAEDVDRGVIQLLLPGLLAVEGVSDSLAISREGFGEVTLDFEPGWDMSRAVSEVETAVAGVTNLPDDADQPVIRRNGWRDRVTDMVVTGPVAPDQLLRIADEFLDRLYRAGVTRATIEGLAAPELTVEVPMAELMRHDLTLSDISARIAAETAADPAGSIASGTARLRTGAERRTPEALRQIVLKSKPDGTSLTLGEVAVITDSGGTGKQAYFVGDNPAIALRADRSADGDAIEIQRKVEQVAEEMRPGLPKGVTIDMTRVRSQDIIARLEILIANGLMGLGLVLAMLFLFLNARTALWVAAGIPVAMLAAVAMMHLFGLTLNMISIFALILTTGIVVDDAIVVGEHADFRFRRLGEAPVVAAETAVRRMAAPVFSSTATTIVAFLGLMAITGRFGEMIRDIPFTVAVVLAASLLEAFLILPNHMAHALTSAGRRRWYDAPSRLVNRGFGWVRDKVMRPLVAGVIVARYPVLAGALALLAYSGGLFLKGEVRWQFFASPEQAAITGNFTMLAGATRADTLEVMRALQHATEEVAADFRDRYGVEPLNYVIAQVGSNAFRPLESAQGKDRDLLGSISIELVDPDLRPWTGSEFVTALQEAAPHHPFLEELSFRGWRHGPGGDALDVQLTGPEAAVLKAAAEDLKHALAPFPEISALEDSLPYDKDELILDLTPQGRALGFTVDDLGRELRARLNGITAASFPEGTRTVDVTVELASGEVTADFLDRMLMRTPEGAYVPLADIVTVEPKSGFSRIRREGGDRVVTVTGDIAEDDPERVAAILDTLNRDILPEIAARHGVGYNLAGLSEQEDTFLSEATTGFAAALVGIYVILAWVFSSWTRPVVVMAVIPFGLIGAIYGHAVWDLPLSMFSVVGLIGMSGIIVNDAIVLISTVDEYAARRPLIPAVIDAVADRLRAVFLTTATTVIGLAPLLFETSRQAQFLKPTVVTLCYGLGFGMLLVLLVVPALLVVQADVGRRLAAFRRGARRGPVRGYLRAAVVILAVLFAALLGPALLAGEGYAPAFLSFAAASAAALGLVWIVAALRLGRAARG